MPSLDPKQAQKLLKEGKKAYSAIDEIRQIQDPKIIEEFLDVFRERFFFLFRNSIHPYRTDRKIIEETSKVVQYLETLMLPNFVSNLELEKLSPEVQNLFFRSINDALVEFKRTRSS